MSSGPHGPIFCFRKHFAQTQQGGEISQALWKGGGFSPPSVCQPITGWLKKYR